MSKKIIFLLTIGLLEIGCSKTTNEIPSYIKVSTASVSGTKYGEPNTAIYGLDISIENDARGTWQIPFLMPVLSEGTKNLVIKPIVKQYNLSTLFEIYPFYKTKILSLNLIRSKEIDTQIYFEYEDSVKMTFYEDMEIKNNFSASQLSSNARNGANSLNITANVSTSDSSTSALFNKPIAMSLSKIVFLEFDYYMPEGVFTPILTYEDANGQRVNIFSDSYLLPNKNWTHVYWNLTGNIRNYGQSQYTLGFVLTVERDKSNANLFLDNIKILEK